MTFPHFDIPSLGQCDSSSLTVYNHRSEDWDFILGVYCNAQYPDEVIRSDFNFLFLKFQTGAEEPGSGFLAEFEQVHRGGDDDELFGGKYYSL